MIAFRSFSLVLLLAALALSGCARSGPPAPVVYGGITPSRLPQTAQPGGIQPGTPGTVTIRRGDTLYSIARTNDVPLRELIQANNLQPPYLLRVGEALRLPNQRVHAVAAGDTLYSIARRYNLDANSLARANNLQAPFTIRVGQRLVLPAPVAVIASAEPPLSSAPPSEPAPSGVPLANPPPTPSPPVADNVPGSPTRLPGAPPVAGESGPVPSEPSPAATPAPAPPQPSGPSSGPASGPAGSAAIATQPPPRSSSSFLMPVNGRVISGFGPKGGGLHNDGLNIAAPRGTPVLAAENGIVVYAGSELRGFGNLLLVNHADGWMTAYAHNEALLVKRGDIVRRGQAIARVGSTGSVDTPQLHFEVRRNSRPVDPQPHVRRSGQAALPGR
ncbi:MAG: LysM peptidoglycan-binding domain-containing M23 family metallopeptidase [Alphaproteobacteria bacterium]|nr:LysM peptidoglycan-binding domain-containing M23 family metallopeptidase [Alphaproteobacteria bacterium]MBU0797103.1 LysM peptidoglycan-binding domain-containing M23 family metallopeptidase [Alphaproteobacteria bacterium]MBU0887910.1 LysM peptidoglycan-binding domain-containing M23 family metallopeptidase [Alphaproteobacteria bacterium]MBU1814867.1 LysM peptidoglycan-binding domain-containing M23 family metallopeptidase [Alphaproteobacteria bacterium]